MSERVSTVVIGGGQAGLSVAYHLAKRGLPFVVLDASARVGDAWRNRWDSLRLFTPARYAGLPGLRFPAKGDAFPTNSKWRTTSSHTRSTFVCRCALGHRDP
jgi:putative flavoprotein involved in K+ transport